MNPQIRRAIERGELVLLLGAGAAHGSLSADGSPLPLANQLAESLAKEAGLEFRDDSLASVYAAAKGLLGDRLLRILESRFRHTRPSVPLRTIASYPWARVYTLNIDDSYENAARSNSAQQLIVRYRYDRLEDRDPFFDKLDIVKLNGSIDRASDGFVFSAQEYGQASANAPFWYNQLADDFFRHTFLFIGTKLDEPLFYHQIERYRAAHGAREGQSYVITPSTTPIQRESLKAINLQHIPGTLESFADWLTSQFPAKPTPTSLAIAQHPELAKIASQPDSAALLRLLEKVAIVSTNDTKGSPEGSTSKSRVRDFYRGFKPTWHDIVDGVPATLPIATQVSTRLSNVKATDKLFVVFGSAGSGKTTALKQISYELSKLVDSNIYYITEPVDYLPDLVAALDRLNSSRYFVFIDRLSMMIDGLVDLLAAKRSTKFVLVATERQNTWLGRIRHRVSTDLTEAFQLSEIGKSEAKLILGKLEKFGRWDRLSRMAPDARIDLLVKHAKKQLLIGLIEATAGIGFKAIIRADFASLDDANQKNFVVLVGLATIHRLPLPLTLASKAITALGITESIPSLLSRTSGIVAQQGDALIARHQVYVEQLFESCVRSNEKLLSIRALLSAFSSYRQPVLVSLGRLAGMLFKLTLNHRFLRNQLDGDSERVLDVYRDYERAFGHDGLFWLQYGLALRDADLHDEAMEKLRAAVEAYPMKQTLHALSHQQLISAACSDSKTEAYSLVAEARETMLKLDDDYIIEDNDYPIVTLSEHHVEVVRRFEGNTVARTLAGNYAKILLAREKSRGHNPRLVEATTKLVAYSKTGNWVPPKINR